MQQGRTPGGANGFDRTTIRAVAAGIDSDGAMTLAALVGMITMAAVLGRDLLRLEGLHDAEPELQSLIT